MTRRDRPIGVFDSGLGGLTVVRALRRIMPEEAFVYLGDTARAPYGENSPATLERYALQAGALLARHDPKLLVVACNTVSALGFKALQAASSCPVIGVLEPGAQAAAEGTGPVGVIGTLATIASGAYADAIHRHRPEAAVHSLACPLLAPLAEEGWLDDPITDAVCRRYLNQIPFEVHTVILGCSHYPLLLPSLARIRPDTTWLDSGRLTAQAVDRLLGGRLGFRTASARGGLRILLTDLSSRTREIGGRFLGEPLGAVESVQMGKD
jgi:glutamate racemase